MIKIPVFQLLSEEKPVIVLIKRANEEEVRLSFIALEKKDYKSLNIDPETFIKERGKWLAKESWKWKKEYIQTLEEKVEKLENQVSKLITELEAYKNKENLS